MTRKAVQQEIEELLDGIEGVALEEFSYDEYGGDIGQSLFGNIVKEEVDYLADSFREEFNVIIEQASREKMNKSLFDKYLEANFVYHNYKGNRKSQLREELKQRYMFLSERLKPAVNSEHDSLNKILEEEYTTDELIELSNELFGYTDRIQKYKRGVEATAGILGIEAEYTIELFKILHVLEDHLQEKFANQLF